MAGKSESETIVLHASLKKNLVFAFTVGFLIAFMIDQVDQVAVAWLVGTVGTSFLIFWLLQAARGLPKLVAHDDRLEIRSMSQARSVPWTECSDIWVWRPLVFPLIAIEYTDSFRATLGRTVSREGVDEAVLAVFKPSADEVCDLLRAKLSRTTAQSNDAAPTNDPDRLVPHGHSNAYRRVVRWLSDNKSIMPVLSICTAIVLATVLAFAYLLGGMEQLLLLLLAIVFVVIAFPIWLSFDWLIEAVLRGSSRWPRASDLLRRVLISGATGWLGVMMGRGAIEQWSHRPLRAVLAGLVSGGLFWLATNSALGRFGRRTG